MLLQHYLVKIKNSKITGKWNKINGHSGLSDVIKYMKFFVKCYI